MLFFFCPEITKQFVFSQSGGGREVKWLPRGSTGNQWWKAKLNQSGLTPSATLPPQQYPADGIKTWEVITNGAFALTPKQPVFLQTTIQIFSRLSTESTSQTAQLLHGIFHIVCLIFVFLFLMNQVWPDTCFKNTGLPSSPVNLKKQMSRVRILLWL